MKVLSIVFSAGLIAMVAALPQESSSAVVISTAPVPTPSFSYGPEVEACLKKCNEADVTCRANCLNSPAPNESMVNENTKCSMECPQGDGSPEDTKKYGECLKACSDKHYNPTVTPTQAPTGTGTDGGVRGTGTGTETGTGTSTATPSSNAAPALAVGGSLSGAMAMALAAFAL